ncbi:Uncharacterized protein Fot_30104 [Forsythia ovata]|uniref:Uncharacterized protein n=1 Tax=Forsythia ovata TaxID=205694 RepID=A0ABD1TTS1_9LAMI
MEGIFEGGIFEGGSIQSISYSSVLIMWFVNESQIGSKWAFFVASVKPPAVTSTSASATWWGLHIHHVAIGLSSSGEVELGDFQVDKGECRAVGMIEHVECCGGNGSKEDNSNGEENGPEACEAEVAPTDIVVVVGGGVWTIGVAHGIIKLGGLCWVGCSCGHHGVGGGPIWLD